jgi:hypothetical protein
MSDTCYDRRGIPIARGDIVKVFRRVVRSLPAGSQLVRRRRRLTLQHFIPQPMNSLIFRCRFTGRQQNTLRPTLGDKSIVLQPHGLGSIMQLCGKVRLNCGMPRPKLTQSGDVTIAIEVQRPSYVHKSQGEFSARHAIYRQSVKRCNDVADVLGVDDGIPVFDCSLAVGDQLFRLARETDRQEYEAFTGASLVAPLQPRLPDENCDGDENGQDRTYGLDPGRQGRVGLQIAEQHGREHQGSPHKDRQRAHDPTCHADKKPLHAAHAATALAA